MAEIWHLGPSGIAVAMVVVGLDVLLAQTLLVKPMVSKLGATSALRVGQGSKRVRTSQL